MCLLQQQDLFITGVVIFKLTIKSSGASAYPMNEQPTRFISFQVYPLPPSPSLSHVLDRIDEVRESDEGVNEVLLISMQAGMEQLQVENQKLKDELEELQSSGNGGGGSSSFRRASSSVPCLDPTILSELQQSVSELEQYMSAASSLTRQVRACEMEISVAQATESMRQLAQQQLSRQRQLAAAAAGEAEASTAAVLGGEGDGWDGADESAGASASTTRGQDPFPSDGGGEVASSSSTQQQQHLSLVGKLQRLEMERRLQAEEISDLGEQLALVKLLADKVG